MDMEMNRSESLQLQTETETSESGLLNTGLGMEDTFWIMGQRLVTKFWMRIAILINVICTLFWLIATFSKSSNSALLNPESLIQNQTIILPTSNPFLVLNNTAQSEEPDWNHTVILQKFRQEHPTVFPLHINKPTKIQPSAIPVVITISADHLKTKNVDWSSWDPKNVNTILVVILRGQFGSQEIQHFRKIFRQAQIFLHD